MRLRVGSGLAPLVAFCVLAATAAGGAEAATATPTTPPQASSPAATGPPQAGGRLWEELPAGAGAAASPQSLPDFVELAAKLGPAVVNISTEQGSRGGAEGSGPEGSPFEQFGPPQDRSLGSGFVINKAGYILTNEHVVENARRIIVTTKDSRQYKARLVGSDAKTDVALLKIAPLHDLPVAPLGNSDDVKVGQWVLAIGDPFGFDHSVTAGIVSAKGRFIPGNYDEFIQTDASINPGNSGGPLINLRGEVVGVNSAIYTRTGTNTGIGFAIPVNLVKEELPELESEGKVVRGWIGVYVQKVTPDIADSLGLNEPRGALVAEVLDDGPGKAAGVKRGDVIVALDGQAIDDSHQLPLLVWRAPIGRSVKLTVVRDKKTLEIPVTITASREAELKIASSNPGSAAASFGLSVQRLSPELRQELGMTERGGVMVSSVAPGSSADEAGLRPRDIILEVNRGPVEDVDSYERAFKAAVHGKVVLLLVRRDRNTIFVALEPRG